MKCIVLRNETLSASSSEARTSDYIAKTFGILLRIRADHDDAIKSMKAAGMDETFIQKFERHTKEHIELGQQFMDRMHARGMSVEVLIEHAQGGSDGQH